MRMNARVKTLEKRSGPRALQRSHLIELRPGQTEEEAINIYGRIRVKADDFLFFLTGPAQALN